MTKTYHLLTIVALVSMINVALISCATTTPSSTMDKSVVDNPYQTSASSAELSTIMTQKSADGVDIVLEASKSLDYKKFVFENPPRVVLDLPHCAMGSAPSAVKVNHPLVASVTAKEFTNEKDSLTRIELALTDVKDAEKITVKDVDKGLRVTLPGTLQFTQTKGKELLHNLETAKGSAALPTRHADSHLNDTKPFIRVAQAQSPSRLNEQTIGTEDTDLTLSEKQYEGIPISLDLKDTDVVDIFLQMSDLTGYNIVVDPQVTGKKINIRMHDVPWDQALDIILKQLQLGKEYTGTKSPEFPKGNIIRIASVGRLQQEAEQRRNLMKAKKIAEPLITKIYYLSYADATQMERKIKKLLSGRGEIIIDKRTNALIVTDIASNLEKIKSMITLLDVRTKQVLISSQIVTTKKDFTKELGIQWGAKYISEERFGNTTGYRFPNNFVIDGTSNGGYAVNLPAGSTVLGISMGNVLRNLLIDVVLSTSETEGLTKVIASPRIMTSDNVAAEIKTGVQIAYTVFSDRGLEVQFKDATISLKVTPHITNDNFIKMKIEAKKDSPDFSVSPPAINTNNAKTEVLVKDGDTIVIGGLNQSTEGWSEERIPLFHRIPFLGWLFKSHSVKNEYDDLMIFISPKIIQQERSEVQTITFDQTTPPPPPADSTN